ncbi:substrate-binding domain-containing protein [Effusibacillus lacus]|uniref:ABC transporter permease n=1 Tax=Effusibacillus lacus TaxID=1348429 RepID=A0A292YM31_9BACL|nr:substrate-binding domain-containing protein [Effusibacillus lacus]TCS73665.1 amino acid/amide ABC transporter substrate-binding protein (HAAT family) [Effusibacillus lacus]GAX89444.1 ABC transporter permease [Effusibacillus lacus]
MQTRRFGRIGLVSVLSASLLMASACGNSTETGGKETGGKETKTPIKIGVVTSKTGPLEAYGKQELNGLKLGIKYATGGTNEVLGRKIEIIEEDDQFKPEEGKNKARKLLEEDKVDILQGTASSPVALAITDLAKENKKIFMIDPATADDLTGAQFHKYVFRTGRNTGQDWAAGAKYAVENLGKTFYHIAPDNAFGKSSAAAARAAIEKLGGQIVKEDFAPATTQDFTPYLQRAIQSNAKVLLITWAGATPLFKQINELGVYQKMTVYTGIPDLAGIKSMGDGAEGMVGFNTYHYTLPKTKENDWLVENHKKEYGTVPDLFTAGGFAAGIAIVEGIKKAGSTDGDKIAAALEGFKFRAAKGEYTFRKEDHQALQPMYIVKLKKKDGELVPELIKELSPEETAPPITVK